MEKSALQKARAAYRPQLPIVLTGATVKVVEGEPTQSAGDQEEIKKLFLKALNALVESRRIRPPAQQSPSMWVSSFRAARLPADTTSSAVSSTASRLSTRTHAFMVS